MHEINVPVGWSVMEGAVKNLVPGINGDCGGACACATCQVHIDEAFQPTIPAKTEIEEATLDNALHAGPNSRLACQITVTSELDGLTVRMPFRQK